MCACISQTLIYGALRQVPSSAYQLPCANAVEGCTLNARMQIHIIHFCISVCVCAYYSLRILYTGFLANV